MIKTFISFDNLHEDKKAIVQDLIESKSGFKDNSVNYKIKHDNLELVRRTIRDNFIKDATVLVLIATIDTRGRRFVDWEIAAAMYDGEVQKDGTVNDICGIVVIDCIEDTAWCPSKRAKEIYEGVKGETNWVKQIEENFDKDWGHLPDRIVDSMKNDANISVVHWNCMDDMLHDLIIDAHSNRFNNKNKYSTRELRKKNSKRQETI